MSTANAAADAPSRPRQRQKSRPELPRAPTSSTPLRCSCRALSNHKPSRALERPIAVRTAQDVIACLATQVNAAANELLIPVDHAHSSSHALRHGYALRYLAKNGPDLAGLQRRLGHTDIATTAKYLAAHQDDQQPAPDDPWARG